MSDGLDNVRDFFGPLFNNKGYDGWMKDMEKEAKERQIETEITELVMKNPEYIHKCGVIDNMVTQLRNKISELNKMKVEVKVDIANRIISTSGDKYAGYTFKVPSGSSSIFAENTPPITKKDGV